MWQRKLDAGAALVGGMVLEAVVMGVALASAGRVSRGVARVNMAARAIVILCFMVCSTLNRGKD
jgi:hypothetical protein